MAIKYKIVEIGRPGTNLEEKEFQAIFLIANNTIDPESFMKMFSQYSRMNIADLYRCLYSLRKLLCEELQQGNIIQTGIIGTFSPSVKKSKRKASKGLLEINVNYQPTIYMKNELKSTELKTIKNKETK